MTKVPQVQRKTVRIAAPACFRAPWLGASTKDIPTQVIQTLVGLTQVSASEFCGGRWTEQEKPKAGCQLVTFLHLKDSLVDTLVQKSGEQGIFCTEIKKQPGEMQTLRAKRNTGVLWNISPQSDCFEKGTQTAGHFQIWSCLQFRDSKPRKARRHVVHHVPRAWGEEEISKFLSDQGWTEVSAVTKRRAAWAFFGLCPAQEATQDTWIFNLTDTSDQTCHTVTIQVDVHTPKQLPQQVPVAAPRRSRTLAMFMPQQDKKTTEVPPADAPAKEEQGVPVLTQQGRATATASGERRERSRTLPVAHAQIDTDQESDVEHQTKKKPGTSTQVTLMKPSSRSVGNVGMRVEKEIVSSGPLLFFPIRSLWINLQRNLSSTHDRAGIRAQSCLHLKKY